MRLRMWSPPAKVDTARVETWNGYRALLTKNLFRLRDGGLLVVICRSWPVLRVVLEEDLRGPWQNITEPREQTNRRTDEYPMTVSQL